MRAERVQLGAYIDSLVSDSEYVFFISYSGVSVAQFSDLRNQLHANEAQCHVLKNTLLNRSIKSQEIDGVEKLAGDTAVVFGSADPCPVAKTIKTFNEDVENVDFKGALIGGKFLSLGDARAMAELPSIDVLRSQLLGTIQAPMTNLVGVLNNSVAQMVWVLKAYEEKLNEQNG